MPKEFPKRIPEKNCGAAKIMLLTREILRSIMKYNKKEIVRNERSKSNEKIYKTCL